MKSLRRGLSSLLYERRYGVSTAEAVKLERLGLATEGRVDYEPSGWRTLRQVLPRGSVTGDDVFLDFGAGMGRILVQAIRYPFGKVIGVELSEDLARIARRNVDAQSGVADSVDVVVADATAYPIPDDVTVVYMHNPFYGEIFKAVLANLIASLDRRPRRLRLIYKQPVEHDLVVGSGRFVPTHARRPLIERLRDSGDRGLIRVYEATGIST
jgi:Methyltransferase domain